jgi:hypothetical protein
MSQENPMVYDLLVNNALLFDGSAVRDGLLSVGIAGNKISFVEHLPPRLRRRLTPPDGSSCRG